MKYCLIMVFLGTFLGRPLTADENVKVTFTVVTIPLADSVKVYVAGNNPQLGNWDAAAVPLERLSETQWNRSFTFERGAHIEYKFTLGGWDSEALTEAQQLPQNYLLIAHNDTSLAHHIKFWKSRVAVRHAGQITGNVEYHHQLNAAGLLPRDLIVWLPPEYDQDEQRRYPVLYMHDGQNIIDPATSSFFVDWQVDEVADSLIRNNLIEPIIIVGIYNTPERRLDYTHTLTGYKYMDFVVNTVKPLVDNSYRTKPGRDHTAVAGSSLGGLISMMLIWEYPDVFSSAACFSPAFKIGELDYVEAVRDDHSALPDIRLYIDNGGIALEAELQPGIDDMLEVLEQKGYQQDRDIIWFKDARATHNESAWAQRVWRPLQWFFGRE